MSTPSPIVIAAAARTPMGAMLGQLTGHSAPQLGAVAIKAAVERAGLVPADIQEVLMGCVLPAGLGQAPARQASKGAGLPDATGATTISKVCGSGLKAAMLAHDLLRAGSASVVVAGGMESMSNAPYLLKRARAGYRFGHDTIFDHMALDGLEDAYEARTPMGVFAERTARELNIDRAAQDAFALESLKRAQDAANSGAFDWEMAPVEVKGKAGPEPMTRDENPTKAKPEKIPTLKPAFQKDGTVTAANASSISDGAAALVLLTEDVAAQKGLTPLARVVAHAGHARAPEHFTTAPVGAIESLLTRAGWSKDSVDLWEINEAFAVVAIAAMRAHDLPHDRVNIHGGACALGHPIGASGARILVTLLGALRARAAKRGVATLCIGGGEAVAMAIETI